MSNSESYSINIPHYYCLEYCEEGMKTVIEIDFREKPIYLSSTLINKWEKPYEEIVITADEKKRMIKNIKNFLVEERGFSEVIIED